MGAALKAVAWRAGNLISRGEATISQRGLEGGGIYSLTPALRVGAPLVADLAPDRSAAQLESSLASKPARLRLSHWLRNSLRLPAAKTALFFEMTAGDAPVRGHWVSRLKALPIRHQGLRPMDEAISTAGGVRFEDLTSDLMLTARPGVFCAGEMLDWEAPTGGYLITGCLATGRWAGRGALRYLAAAD
jgi:predicted flavoprotein YhiN